MNGLVKSHAKSLDVSSYTSLREQVRETLLEGQQKIERQKVLTYWHTGKLIKEHLLLNKNRADLGKKVIQRLADDLQIDESNLWKILRFARAFPVLDARPELTWAHYRVLTSVPNQNKRLALAEQAAKNKWTSRELEIKVRNHKWAEYRALSDGKRLSVLPFVCLGPFGTYKIIRPKIIHSDSNELLVDFGFGHTVELRAFGKKHFAEGSVVRAVQDARGPAAAGKRYPLEKISASQAAGGKPDDLLYTYKAYVEKVLDGDTLKVEFHFGFGKRQREVIRLNHIDCPELSTPEGRAAKRFVAKELAPAEWITVKSVRTRKEKWGRYLGDVFYEKKAGFPIYLNQLLLDKGLAVRVF